MNIKPWTKAMTTPHIEYPDDFLERLEILWGRGFLSPGGASEVREIVEGLDLAGKTILDLGCGTAGPDMVLAGELGADHIVAIDIEAGVLARARSNVALSNGLADRIEFSLVEPGPLPFPDESFDVVFSKDVIVQIPDKEALFREVLRVLRPGGIFAGSDWLGSETTATSPEWARFRELGHLSFVMATAPESEALMRAAGFVNVVSRDRNAWYAEECADEVRRIEGPLRESLLKVVDGEVYTHWLAVRSALRDSVAAGALRPTHLRGSKP
jgi:phosphoethanolamine N-methyltransferase